MASALQSLAKLRGYTSGLNRVTKGITSSLLERFDGDKQLNQAATAALSNWDTMVKKHGDKFVCRDEPALLSELQEGFVNFYDPGSLMPYVPLAAKGPWIVTTHGAVLHDSGGYGMLGFGHNADFLQPSVEREQCMANVMTPSFSQRDFIKSVRSQIGFNNTSTAGCPYDKFMCMNSGSEAVELSTRMTDVAAKIATAPGGVHEGRSIRMMCLEGSFYGRTYRPARLSHSCRGIYQQHLASFDHDECHLPIVVPANDVAALEAAFAQAEADNVHIEALYMEPMMGEGQPGVVLDRDFYDAARRLTKENSSLLIVDSIQAALRARGSLSVIDYPGFETAEAPDMETYSKAVNAGQVPFSILALQQHVADRYVVGLYGNTMTTNPRALDIATATMNAVTPAIRSNILERGEQFQEEFGEVCKENSDVITHVTGGGLLQAVHLASDIPMFGGNYTSTPSFLARCRQNGLGIINAAHTVKFTPHFEISEKEVTLLADVMKHVVAEYKEEVL